MKIIQQSYGTQVTNNTKYKYQNWQNIFRSHL